MTNVIFDLSNMFHRSMFIVGGFGSKGFTFDSQDELDQLIRKVSTDVAFTLRQINPTRVIFAVDSKSWRKEIEIEENEGYKGHREYSDHLNWTNIYGAMDEFSAIMSEKGLVTTKIEKAEADDVMALWRDELLFNQNGHVILVSGDEDIRQLVAFNFDGIEKHFAVLFNPFTQGKNKKKLFYGTHFKEWLQEDDGIGSIFNRGLDTDKESFLKLIKENPIDIEFINGEELALRKIFCGDDGDNVPAIYTWEGKTSKGETKTYRITNQTFKKILDKIKEVNMSGDIVDFMDLPDHKDLIYNEIAIKAKHKPPFKIEDRLRRQIRLVVLSRSVFPKKLVENFDSIVEESLAKTPTVKGWHMQSLLEGTRYVNDNYARNKTEASIFKEIDEISKKLF